MATAPRQASRAKHRQQAWHLLQLFTIPRQPEAKQSNEHAFIFMAKQTDPPRRGTTLSMRRH
eukprot:2931433-Alexandrium_andersonii.AAC.1